MLECSADSCKLRSLPRGYQLGAQAMLDTDI